jgi:hypothetical protein
MAIIRKGAMGDISGRIGDTVYRVRNHKNIGCKRPTSQKISQTENSVKNRSKFAYTIQFAKIINSNPELLSCWKSAEIKGTSGFQRIIKHNSKNVSALGITSKNIITPPGIEIVPGSISINESTVTISSFFKNDITNPLLKLFTVMKLYNEEGSELLYLQSDNVSLKEGIAPEGTIALTPDELKKLIYYKKAILLCAFITSSPKPFWSTTIPFELNLCDRQS